MQQYDMSKIRKWAIIALLLLAIWGGYMWYSQVYLFRVTGSVPAIKGTVATSTALFEIHFNKSLKSEGDYAKTADDKDDTIIKTEIDDKILRVYVKDLEATKKYQFILRDITAQNGMIIKNLPISVTAKYIPESELSPEERQLLLSQTDPENNLDPLLTELPSGGLHFTMTSPITKTDEGKWIIDTELLLSASDVRTDRAAALADYQLEAQDYIRSLGLKVEDYEIRYNVTEPSLY